MYFYKQDLTIKKYTTDDIKNLRKKYQSLEQKIYWKSFIEDIVDVSQLIHVNFQKKNQEKGSPKRNFELFGIENYKAYMQAREFLSKIPEGSLVMTPELIKQVHIRSASHLKNELNWTQKIMSSMFVEPGVYKKRNNRGEDPLFNPLSEEQYQVVKSNPYSRFVELPWPLSRESKRRGYILYGEKNSVERDIQDLSDWTNVQLEKIRAGEADPIEVAAEFQWRYVSIHPMIDGNGRTSMLLANRILEEADLPPILMTFSGYDIYYTPKVWSEKIKEAIFDFEQMVNDSKFLASIEKETPNLHMSNFSDGPRMALTPESFSKGVKKSAVNRLNGKIESRWPLLKRELFAANENQEVNIGNQRFVAMMDGFFYSNMGVPHAIHSEIINGQKQYKLYPVADSVGVLYSMGGMSSNKRFFQRSMNPFMRDHFREFFGFLKIYEKTPDMGSRVDVLDYSLVESANKAGQFFLHDWQRPLLKAALEIKDTDPLKVLAPGRGYHSQYEKSIHFGHKTNLHEVLAQYTMMELKYSKMESYARSNSMTEEIQIIQASRKKLFQAAKTLLAEKTVALERALTETPEKFPSSQEWQFFLSYYRVSPMKYKDFESYAASKDANNVVLIRADQGASRYLGFISNALFRELIDKLPLNETLKSYMNKLDSALAPNASKAQKDFLDSSLIYKSLKGRITDLPRMISNLNRVLQMSKYDTRGMAKEFERVYIEHYLHSVNDPFKTGISFSTNTSIYIRSKQLDPAGDADASTSKDIIPFTFDADNARVYFVRFPKDIVAINEASKYFRQYEVLKSNIALPFGIVDSFSTDFFNSDGVVPTDKVELKKMTDFESTFTTINVSEK